MLELDRRLVLTPGDVVDHVECAHRTVLHRMSAHPPDPDGGARHGDAAARARGRENQATLLRTLAPADRTRTVSVPALDHPGFLTATAATLAAMRARAEVVADAVLYVPDGPSGLHHGRLVRINALVRSDAAPSAWGSWSYAPVVTTLREDPSDAVILKLGLAADQLARVQGSYPTQGLVLTPGAQRRAVDLTPLRAPVADLLRAVDRTVREPSSSPPIAIPSCGSCPFTGRCGAARERATEPAAGRDGPRRDGPDRSPTRGRRRAPTARRSPRRGTETSGSDRDALRASVRIAPLGAPGTGILGLPRLTAHDLSLDFELTATGANPRFVFEFASMRGDDPTSLQHRSARTPDREAAHLLELLEQIEALVDEHPDAHVYHVDTTELAVLRDAFLDPARGLTPHYDRLAALVDRRAFVDLARLARETFTWAGGRRLKDYEALTGFTRTAFVRDGLTARRYGARWLHDGSAADLLHRTQEYCAEDVRSTRALQRWLEHRALEVESSLLTPLDRYAHTPEPLTKAQRFALSAVANDAASPTTPTPTLADLPSLLDAGQRVAQSIDRQLAHRRVALAHTRTVAAPPR